MGIFIATVAGLLLGVALIALGWRGRRAGDHLYCRACGFDLHGRPSANAPCPECGADTTPRSAVVVGQRRVRRGLLWTGVAIVLLAGAGAGLWSVEAARAYNWRAWKPLGWTLNDAVAQAGAPNEPNVAELRRRFGSGSLNAGETERLVQAALDIQGDRTIGPWPEPWRDLLGDLLAANHLTDADLQRYFAQGSVVTFTFKPAIRRGRGMSLDLDSRSDRLLPDASFRWERTASAVKVGDHTIVREGSFEYPGGHVWLTINSGYGMGLQIDLDDAPLGPTRLTTTLTYTYTLVEPIQRGPVAVQIPIDEPVTLADHDAIVDRFEADPALRDAMASSIKRVRVETEGDETHIWLRIEQPPVALAMSAHIRDAAGEQHAIGSFRHAHTAPQWIKVRRRRGGQPTPGATVDVILRPAQEPADSTMTLDTYWGEPIEITGVIVDAPYDVPFNRDRSLAEAMVKAISVDGVAISDAERGRLGAQFNARNLPGRVAYHPVVRTGVQQSAVNHVDLRGDAGDNTGYGTGSLRLPDPGAKTMDILLVPDRDWESRSSDPTPPWGYTLIFEDVPVPAEGDPPAGPYAPRVLWPDEAESSAQPAP